HEYDRRLLVGFTEFAHQTDHLRQGRAGRKRAQIRRLVDGPVGHRIGKRDAELDDVSACRRQLLEQRKRSAHIGVARRNEGQKSALSGALQLRELRLDSIHIDSPNAAAAEKTSLSPRPERQTTMISSFFMWGATRAT